MEAPLVRAAHLMVYAEVLQEIGAPVDQHLTNAGLPLMMDLVQDSYLHVPRVLDFVSRATRDVSVTELGFVASQKSSLSMLSSAFQRALLTAPNGLQRIRQLVRFDRIEDGALRSAVIRKAGFLRLICNLEDFRDSKALAYSEWLQIQGMISIVRSVAGPEWSPTEVTFISGEKCSTSAREAYGNARMLFGQPNTSIIVPIEVLAWPCSNEETAMYSPACEKSSESLLRYLKKAIKANLAGSPPSLSRVADLAGMSSRSLQRKLALLGQSYSDILAESRYETAASLLSNSSVKVIDIAHESGYEVPQHFSRAFRQMAGISPREYRKSLSHR